MQTSRNFVHSTAFVPLLSADVLLAVLSLFNRLKNRYRPLSLLVRVTATTVV